MPDASVGVSGLAPVVVAGPATGDSSATAPNRPLNVIPGSDPKSCGGGTALACSNVLGLFYGRMAGYADIVERACRILEASGSSSDANLIEQCGGYLHGIPGEPASSITEQLDSAQRSLQELAQVAGLPPVRLR